MPSRWARSIIGSAVNHVAQALLGERCGRRWAAHGAATHDLELELAVDLDPTWPGPSSPPWAGDHDARGWRQFSLTAERNSPGVVWGD
jgi:hypothetical protein